MFLSLGISLKSLWKTLCHETSRMLYHSFYSLSAGKAPFSSVITHGFVLDEKGFKMSKSMGNVVDPRSVIEGNAGVSCNGFYLEISFFIVSVQK